MVNSAIFLPAEDDLACLKNLHGHIRVLRRRFESEVLDRRLNQVLIVADDGTTVCISSDYGDVVFKFECFFLKVFPCARESWSDTVEICELDEWDSIKCLFRFEYERPTANGEMPGTSGQVVGKFTKQSEIPGEATAIGGALVGIVFQNSVEECPVLSIANEDIDCDDPTAIRVSKERQMIESITNSCESVAIADVPRWVAEVRRWLDSR